MFVRLHSLCFVGIDCVGGVNAVVIQKCWWLEANGLNISHHPSLPFFYLWELESPWKLIQQNWFRYATLSTHSPPKLKMKINFNENWNYVRSVTGMSIFHAHSRRPILLQQKSKFQFSKWWSQHKHRNNFKTIEISKQKEKYFHQINFYCFPNCTRSEEALVRVRSAACLLFHCFTMPRGLIFYLRNDILI